MGEATYLREVFLRYTVPTDEVEKFFEIGDGARFLDNTPNDIDEWD